jgi:elongation factor Ts
MVKDLREKTGMGMMECKKALEENAGDMEKAIVWLRERGMSRAAKKADKIAAEGVVEVYISPDRAAGVLLEVNCQTDFVAKNEDFVKIAKEAAEAALKTKASTVQELAQAKITGGTVQDRLVELAAKIGEKMELRRLKVVQTTNGVVAGYSHMGGRIGTLVVLEGAKGDDVETLGKDIAMHVAAASPRYLTEAEIDQSELDTEREIARKKLEEEGKKPDMIDKILVGQMKKFAKEVCLVDQPFVKDQNVTVSKHVENSKKGLELAGFARFALGEGIEKKVENFAEEVAAQAAAAAKKH